MRKEVLIAIVAGIAFGVVIAFGVWRANIALKPQATSTENTTKKDGEKAANDLGFGLTIANAQNNDVVTQSSIEISGITSPITWITVSTEEEDFVFTSGENGEFSQEIDLIGGVNQLVVSAYSENGNQISQNINLIYSTQFEKEAVRSEEEDSQATEEADPVRQKVREKLAEAKNVPKAYLGTITDITEDTIQVKGDNGNIDQITIDEESTSYVQLGKTQKTLEFKDVAIGDYIIALGYLDENNVLESSRVLITEPLGVPTRKITWGKVKDVEKKVLTLSTSDDTEFQATFPTRWKGPEISELETDGVVVIITIPDEDKLEIRTIEILE